MCFFFFIIPDTWWSSSHCHQVPGAPAHECVSYWNISTSKRPERGSSGVKGTLLFVTREGRGGFTCAQNLCLAPSGQEEVDGCGARGRGTFFVFVFGHITFSPFQNEHVVPQTSPHVALAREVVGTRPVRNVWVFEPRDRSSLRAWGWATGESWCSSDRVSGPRLSVSHTCSWEPSWWPREGGVLVATSILQKGEHYLI